MAEEYHKISKNVWRNGREIDREIFEGKIRECYKKVNQFVEKEILKGMLPYQAIEKVISNASLEKLCPELRDDKVKRTIRARLLNYYFRKPNKRNENKEKEKGER